MNRGSGRRPIFRFANHHALFLELLGEISMIYRLEVHAYCLMANHYHLLVRTPNAGLGRAMRHLDGVYTQRFNLRVGTDGPLFRGRYKSVLLGEESYLRCVSRYIHLNPVEAKLVTRPEAYRESSYRAFLGLDIVPFWLLTSETLKRFEPGNARQNYRRFVEDGIDESTRAFYAKQRLRPVLGSSEFRDTIEKELRSTKASSDPERPDFRILTESPALGVIAAAVCQAFGVRLTEIRPASRRRIGVSAARGAFVLLSREFSGQSIDTISKWIGYRSYMGASKAMGRLRAMRARQPDIHARIEAARCELNRQIRPRSDHPTRT